MSSEKSSWPEVVGLPAEEAKRTILRDRPDVHVIVAPVGSPGITDFNEKRVRVFVNDAGIVVEVPRTG
uniref:Uncharacterized protein n=1 Tax=Leersia perrieri TaxID=77586 RepID=A0A0D9WEP6_9ORYZ